MDLGCQNSGTPRGFAGLDRLTGRLFSAIGYQLVGHVKEPLARLRAAVLQGNCAAAKRKPSSGTYSLQESRHLNNAVFDKPVRMLTGICLP
jgi:hypothetical protein